MSMMGHPLFNPVFYAGFRFDYDKNGNMIDGVSSTLVYNWDNKLRSAAKGADTISLKYDPLGNRIWKQVNDGQTTTTRKYIVDIVPDLPVILMKIDTADSSIKKTYIYANSQLLAQHNGNHTADRYFYLHDRLGSVRQIIKYTTSVELVSHYTYNPFGELFPTEFSEGVSNPFKFTGQYYDSEISQYYLRARQYSPHLYRFTGRDPVFGEFERPLTLHKYLYCGNEPISRFDLSGLWMVDRWQGHVELTYRSMQQWGFSLEQITWAIIGNVWTDYRKDHDPRHWRDLNPIPHYVYGKEAEAEAHAMGAMEVSLLCSLAGEQEYSMLMLGTALHTYQDRWAHSEQGRWASSWFGHIWEYDPITGIPGPDNPELHRSEYRSAYFHTQGTLLNYLEHRRSGEFDLDSSGTIGNGFIWSDPREDFGLKLVELAGEIANGRWTDWLEWGG